MDFQVFHAYSSLFGSLSCPDCGNELITRLGKNDEPVLWCYSEDRYIYPGLDLYNQLEAAVQNEKNRVS